MGIDGDYFPRVGDMIHLATERDSALREGDFVLIVREKTPLGLLVEKRQRRPAQGYETNTDSTRKEGWMVSRACGGAPVIAYPNEISQWVVRVEWATGPVHLVSVRECVRYAERVQRDDRGRGR